MLALDAGCHGVGSILFVDRQRMAGTRFNKCVHDLQIVRDMPLDREQSVY